MEQANCTTNAARQPTANRYPIAVIGFVCLYAICVSFFYSSWLIGRPDFSPATFDNVLNPSILAASLLLSLLVSSRLPLRRTVYLTIGYGGFAFALGSAFSPQRRISTLP